MFRAFRHLKHHRDGLNGRPLPPVEGIGPLIRDPLRILLRRELFPVARLKRNVAMTADIIEMRGKVLRALLPPRNLDQHLRGSAHDARKRRPNLSAAKRSEEHTSELQSLMRNSYSVFCLKKKINTTKHQ